MNTALLVFLGGGTGSVARWALMNIIKHQTEGSDFPWHTLGVNILGAFIIGLLAELLALKMSMAEPARFLLVTGFLGGFTTFSAFSLESTLMLQKGDYMSLGAYIGSSVIGTIIAVFLGGALMKSVL